MLDIAGFESAFTVKVFVPPSHCLEVGSAPSIEQLKCAPLKLLLVEPFHL